MLGPEASWSLVGRATPLALPPGYPLCSRHLPGKDCIPARRLGGSRLVWDSLSGSCVGLGLTAVGLGGLGMAPSFLLVEAGLVVVLVKDSLPHPASQEVPGEAGTPARLRKPGGSLEIALGGWQERLTSWGPLCPGDCRVSGACHSCPAVHFLPVWASCH